MEGSVNYNYLRTAPRDLFNEAKLLKCLGQLGLHVWSGEARGVRLLDNGASYRIGLHQAGYLVATGGIAFFKDEELLWLGTVVNSKEPYPLFCVVEDVELAVFNDDGTLSKEFRAYLEKGELPV